MCDIYAGRAQICFATAIAAPIEDGLGQGREDEEGRVVSKVSSRTFTRRHIGQACEASTTKPATARSRQEL
jgi:hypothetical protein